MRKIIVKRKSRRWYAIPPALTAIAPEAKAKDTGQTILKKQFSNGTNLTLGGANSPGSFHRITCRIILFDAVNDYAFGGPGAEGDQIALGTKRSETFWNRKIVLGSTPRQ
ncbi:phage terminase large subunit family protein [Arsenophonus endosymbiont of Bemisia tabaci]|uniref:phage terminase large subunit family protein n=1 Tax=Arsenophonus endosymbiont of Bemisia tabaci TaxID=536059 RepID=UPI0030B84C77